MGPLVCSIFTMKYLALLLVIAVVSARDFSKYKPGWMRNPTLVKMHEAMHGGIKSGIVGGDEAVPHSHPHQVGLFIDDMYFLRTLAGILTDRDEIAGEMQNVLDEATDPWGIKVERVEIKDVRLPQSLQRAMAAEAEASREAKAKIIAAQGEMDASKALREASDIINQSPGALQLRYLQTLTTISAEKNSTIVFPLPIDMLQGMNRK